MLSGGWVEKVALANIAGRGSSESPAAAVGDLRSWRIEWGVWIGSGAGWGGTIGGGGSLGCKGRGEAYQRGSTAVVKQQDY